MPKWQSPPNRVRILRDTVVFRAFTVSLRIARSSFGRSGDFSIKKGKFLRKNRRYSWKNVEYLRRINCRAEIKNWDELLFVIGRKL